MQTPGFDDKLIARLGKLDPLQLQAYVARLLGQKQFLLSVCDALDEGVIVTNRELALLFANRRARQMLGWPRQRQFLGEDLATRVPPDHPLRATFEGLRENPRLEEPVESPYGRRQDRRLALTTQLIASADERDANDEEMLLLILLRDVTERRRRQSEQARSRRLASLATLTAGIAHEIKNPLNSLNIHAQLLQGHVEETRLRRIALDPEKVERATRVVLEETERLGRIIEDFLQAARPRSPRLQPTELRPIFERAERIFSPDCERAGIAFSMAIDPEIPPLLLDEHLLLQALRNLVRNAIEAVTELAGKRAAAGEAYTPWIRLLAEFGGDVINLIVADNGPGIDEHAIEHIFEPYYTTKFNGTGLGLMVVYRIVTEHRGALHVDTQPGEGTRFVISIPLHQRPIRLLGHDAPALPAVIAGVEKISPA